MTTQNNFNFNDLMKQAQHFQNRMQEMQEQLTKLTVKGKAGVDPESVTVIMDGRYKVVSMNIALSVLKEEKDVIEDLIVAAYNAAAQKVEEASRQKLSELTAGIQLPKEKEA